MRKLFGIAAILAATTATPHTQGYAQGYGSSAPQTASVPAAQARDLAGPEINQLIYGRTIAGAITQGPEAGVLYTQRFNADGSVTSTQGSSGSNEGRWRIVGNAVRTSWPWRELTWGVRTDGAGRYFKVMVDGATSEFTIQ